MLKNNLIEFKSENIEFHGSLTNNTFLLAISLTDYCNYQCSYCSAGSINYRNKNLEFPKYEYIINIIDRISNMYNNVHITLSGGEPTIHPNFTDIINHIVSLKNNVSLEIISNGTQNIEYYKNIFSIIKNIEVIFQISIHLEFIKDLDNIKKLIILSNEYNLKLYIKLMCHPLFLEKTKYFFEELYKFRDFYNFNLWPSIIYENNGKGFSILDNRYTNEYLEYISFMKHKFNDSYENDNTLYNFDIIYKLKNNDEELIIKNEDIILYDVDKRRNFKDMYCCYGIKNMHIWTCGTALGGVCNVFHANSIYNKIYNWIDNIGYIKCPFELCLCPLNDVLPKFREEEDAKKYIENYKKENAYLFLNDAYNQISILENNFNIQSNNINYILCENVSIIHRIINMIAWWIPIKKLRENFRNKILHPEQSRAEQSRAEQSRAEQSRYVAITYVFIIIKIIKNYNLCCNTKMQHSFYF